MSDSKFTIIATLYVEKMETALKYVCAISNDFYDLDDDEKMKHIKAIRDLFKEKYKEMKQIMESDND